MKRGQRVRFTDHDRMWSWLLPLALVLVAVMSAIAQVLGWPAWARLLSAVLAGAVPLVVGALQNRIGKSEDQKGLLERDQQVELEAAVGPGKAALVVGPSMSGKTRLAVEVIKRKFPDALLLSAESGKALREMLDGGLVTTGIVVWLDELERFLEVDGLTVGLLNRLTDGRAIVIATIRSKELELYQPSDELHEQRPIGGEVVKQFNEISLERRLTGPELDRVRAANVDPGVLAAVYHYGLAEYLGAGPVARQRFEKGEITSPVGHALVQAAVDWRRTGLIRPVSEQILTTMLPTYLADRPNVPRTNQAIKKGLAWATKKINETVALLDPNYTDPKWPVFKVLDYLLDQPTSLPVPDPTWAIALEQAKSAELITISLTAARAEKQATAEMALRQAAGSGDAEVAPVAGLNLGLQLKKQGDLEGAKAAFQQVIASGYAEWAPWAMVYLGQLLELQGDLKGAKAAFQQAIASGHADQAPLAALSLGALLMKQGDLEGAKTFYQQAI